MDSTLSIIPSDGATNEFPVLKAFQEYIDAEQAKARKRMLGLSLFFIVLLIVVVVTFVLVLTTVINRNQALSDRLLDYALKEREKPTAVQPMQVQPVAPQPSVQDILKPFLERFEKEQAAMKAAYEKQQKEAEAKAKEAEAKAAARETARNEELRKARAELEKERERIKKANDRQEEIERHRRRLYPDYYRIPAAPEDALQNVAPTRPATPPPSQVSQPVVPTVPAAATPSQSPAASRAPAPQQKPADTKPTPSLSTIKPVTYFNMDDDDGVPFLLETPKPTQK